MTITRRDRERPWRVRRRTPPGNPGRCLDVPLTDAASRRRPASAAGLSRGSSLSAKTAKPKLFWVGANDVPPHVLEAAARVGELQRCEQGEPLGPHFAEGGLAVVWTNGESHNAEWLAGILEDLRSSPTVGLFLLPGDARVAREMIDRERGQAIHAPADTGAEALGALLSSAAAFQPAIGHLYSELADVRSRGDRAVHTLEEVDEEMRLAARLQRDFLPRRLPEVGPARFAALYRPASWVSGDIYDVVRLDETHVGFYVADVVGHGMPAALLTMFIKKALQTKHIVGSSYEIIPPHISLAELNVDICDQNLPSCQFCTAVYCVLDTETLKLTYSRGGHPEPVVVAPNGTTQRLWGAGSLLGVFPEEEFVTQEHQLRPGDRLVLYTDGAEEALCRQATGEILPIERSLCRWANLTREEMVLQISAGIESRQDGHLPVDDITVLVLDIEG